MYLFLKCHYWVVKLTFVFLSVFLATELANKLWKKPVPQLKAEDPHPLLLYQMLLSCFIPPALWPSSFILSASLRSACIHSQQLHAISSNPPLVAYDSILTGPWCESVGSASCPEPSISSQKQLFSHNCIILRGSCGTPCSIVNHSTSCLPGAEPLLRYHPS